MNKSAFRRTLSLLSLAAILFFAFQTSVLAVEDYVQVLAPLPGTTINGCTGPNCTANIQSYIPGVFKLVIGLAALLAVGYIIWGGVQYITTDAWQSKNDGKNRIKNAIIGLIIIMCSYLILYTINPNLLSLNLNIDSRQINTPAGPAVSGSCSSCIDFSDSLNFKPGSGTQLNEAFGSKLENLDDAMPSSFVVTEGYPPVANHDDTCHASGTCADVRLINPTADRIKQAISAASASGLNATWEVRTAAEKTTLVNAGVPAGSILVNDKANSATFASHFHIK